MILRHVYSNRVWNECAEFALKLHKIQNLGTLSLKTLAAKSDVRFSKWRKFLLTKSSVFYGITYSAMIFIWIVFPFSLTSSIFISSKQPRSTDVRGEKLSPHNTSITSSMLKVFGSKEAFKQPIIFCNQRFH